VLRTVLGRYRVMAYLTGVLLVTLVFIGLPLQFFAGKPQVAYTVGTAHGFAFMVYILATLHLGYQRRWPLLKLGLVALAGTVPFASFVAEHRIVREERERLALPAAQP
jgi:integral membrane protein